MGNALTLPSEPCSTGVCRTKYVPVSSGDGEGTDEGEQVHRSCLNDPLWAHMVIQNKVNSFQDFGTVYSCDTNYCNVQHVDADMIQTEEDYSTERAPEVRKEDCYDSNGERKHLKTTII